jgi:ABC-type multidrug transport system ATPase subunit
VNNLSLAVEYGECLGLLGPNGAGKTTTIRMLCGMLQPSSGRAWSGGYDAESQRDSLFRKLGVCPQFDSVWEDLTVEQHFTFYARMKGILGGAPLRAVRSRGVYFAKNVFMKASSCILYEYDVCFLSSSVVVSVQHS